MSKPRPIVFRPLAFLALTVALATLLSTLPACVQPLHLQYDYGRAIEASSRIQADRERPSAATAVYPLTGPEALLIIENVQKEDAAAKSGKAESTADK